MKPEKFITTKELCSLLDITPMTIYNWRLQGMPFEKLGARSIRFIYADVLEWLKERNTEVTEKEEG